MRVAEEHHGFDHAKIVRPLLELATLFIIHESARPLVNHALRISERDHGPNTPILATDLLRSARFLLERWGLSRFAEARRLLERALSMMEKVDRHPPDVIKQLVDTTCVVVSGTISAEEARLLRQRTLAVVEGTCDADSGDLEMYRSYLAELSGY